MKAEAEGKTKQETENLRGGRKGTGETAEFSKRSTRKKS